MTAVEAWNHELKEVAIGKHALAYTRKGWPVFPLWWPSFAGVCACRDGGECSSAGKHPLVPGGANVAVTDAAQVGEWWSRWPHANIGIATGESCGFDVLDVDVDKGGDRSMHELLKKHGRPQPTLVSITGSGGRHIMWKHRETTKLLQSVRAGLDVRTTGGYIVAPPSLHACGERYRWHKNGHPRDVQLAESPEWAAELMSLPARRSTGGPRPSSKEPMPEGSRNNGLFRLACRWQRLGWNDEKIDDEAHHMNRKLCQPPLGDKEVQKIVESVLRYPKGD